MSEPRQIEYRTKIENALQEVFHAPTPEARFVSNLERSLLAHARQESQAPSLSQRFSALLSSSVRGVAWGVGALMLVLVLVWGIRNLIPVVLPAQRETPTPANIATPLETSPMPAEESQTYTNPENGFTFKFPGDWTLEEAPHYVFLRKGPFRLVIAYRRPEESHNIQPTGMPSGELIDAGSVMFLGQEVSREELVMDDRVKRVLYDSAREIQFKNIAFVLMLDAGQNDYTAIDIPEEIQAVADQVLASFNMEGLQPLPDILSSEGLGRVAYNQAGDIWVKPLPDGDPIRLTTDGSNSSPLWSPSGRWLAYRHGEGQLTLVRTDGSAAHRLELGAVAEYAWSPTADQLAFTLSGDRQGELWVVNADGTRLVNVVPREAINDNSGQVGGAGGFLWHPLGGLLIYTRWVGTPDGPSTFRGIWEVNSFTGEDIREIDSRGLPQDSEVLLAGWLAEGKILMAWAGELGSVSAIADGTSLWQLPYDTDGQAEPISEMLTYTDYLSPDPTNTGWLVAISGIGRESWTDKSLFLYDSTALSGRTLTGSDQATAFPAFSPNGLRLAYVAMPDQETGLSDEALHQALLERDLWLLEPQSENPDDPARASQFTSDPAYRDERPEWSNAGEYLLFPRIDAADYASVWLAPVEGGEPVQVIDSLATGIDWFGYYGYIDWDFYYDWWQPPAVAPDEYPPLPALPEAVATPAGALESPTATFSEPMAGYTFDYPQGWYLNSVPGTTEIDSSDPHTWATKGVLPPGETQVLFINDAALKGASFTDVRDVTYESIDLSGEKVLQEENWSLPGGMPAVRLLVSGPAGEYTVLITVLDGEPLQVYGFGDLAIFDAIITTLR